jgi:glycosyltransferase involved in cell wall biosynthesis
MHIFGIFFFFFISLFWLIHGLYLALGGIRLPWLKNFTPATDADCPAISLIFAARDEEEKLSAALATLIAIDYPRLEIIAVNDRSKDATAHILDDAATHSRLHVVHIDELPPGWLGKPHALQKAYESSTGDWLLFTDADVRLKPDTLRRAISLAKARKLDHLTLFCDLEMVGFWERVLITFFGLWFYLATDPARVSNPGSPRYVGVGAFQLLRRSAYEKSGTHQRLAMEVLDDMKLGKIVKQAGFRSECAIAHEFVTVRWHAGLGNLVRGVTKNLFASAEYSLVIVAVLLTGLLMMNILPFVGVIFGHGWVRIFCGISVAIIVCFHAGAATVMRVSPLYGLTHPLGALLFCYMLLRSTVVTLKQGGIIWRGTFYPLEDLKRGAV